MDADALAVKPHLKRAYLLKIADERLRGRITVSLYLLSETLQLLHTDRPLELVDLPAKAEPQPVRLLKMGRIGIRLLT